MTLQAKQTVAITGVTLSFAAVALADEFPNDGRTFLYVKNGSGSTITVTITTPQTVKGIAISDPSVSITAGSEKCIGPFDPSIFNAADGNVDVAYSAITTVTCAVIQLP